MSDILLWIWLSTKIPQGSPYADLLMDRFEGSARNVFDASAEELSEINGLPVQISEALCNKDLAEANKILDWCTQNNVGLLPYDSKFYPKRLRSVERAPLLLYYKGRLIDFDDNVCIAMVGTRRMTEYGKREAYRIARDLTLGGAIVVSGMARGIDTTSHRGALDASGYTVAVLGCGIDRAYPSENGHLMNEIIRSGVVITEYKPFTPPIGTNFPTRNRIISALSLGTLVVEADAKSGAMITARVAEKQGRDIFSLPGNVGELNSIGPNRLLKKGAKVVTAALDILEEYEYLYPHRIRIENLPVFMPKFIPKDPPKTSENTPVIRNVAKKTVKTAKKDAETEEPVEVKAPARDTSSLSENEKKIYSLFPESGAISADELSRSGLSVGVVLQNLTMLEIKGFVKAAPGGVYVKS